MNLIDISSWQGGMNLATMFSSNKTLAGVVVKISQGIKYINPFAKEWLDWLVGSEKPFGVYHYLDIYGAEDEARHFVEAAKPYIGKAVLVIDYEDKAMTIGSGYLKQTLDKVYELTGVKPLVYVSQSVIKSQDFTGIAAAGYPLWVAQYADYNPVYGFLDNPWSSGTPDPFPKYTMRQYTSSGRLNGWNGNLDFDLFYGNRYDWDCLVGSKVDPPAGLKGPDPEVISNIMDGLYGIGQERVNKLLSAGYDPDKVQEKINELYGIAFKIKAETIGNEEYFGSVGKILKTI